MGLSGAGHLIVTLTDNEIRITTASQALKRVRNSPHLINRPKAGLLNNSSKNDETKPHAKTPTREPHLMTDVVLDASAILAVIFDEPGADRVAAHLPGAQVSTVNVAEVATRLFALEMPEDTVETIIDTLQLTIQPFDYGQVLETARLRSATRAKGLSLGDRACLALAKGQALPALTTDTVWRANADEAQVRVELVR